MFKIIVIVIILYKINLTKSANILAVFPFPSMSHQLVFRSLTKKLASMNHNVTVITPNPEYKKREAPDNVKEIDVHEVSYKIYEKILHSNPHIKENNRYIYSKSIFKISSDIFEAQMLNKQVQEIINGINNFDLILVEAFLKPCLGFLHLFKGPVIQFSSLGPVSFNQESFGIPGHLFLYPSFWFQRIYNLTIFEKFVNLHTEEWWLKNIKMEQENEDDKIIKKIFGSESPNINELKRNVDMLFLNVHPIFFDNQPLPPDVVCLSGMHIKPIKKLPKDLKNLLDSSKHGVIYFSLGMNVQCSTLPSKILQIFINTFSSLPYDILWQCDEDILREISANIKISKWFPQSDLLAHPKVKLFITQGGLQSTDEAINAGVPLIGLPMLSDQFYNVEKYIYHKIGLKVEVSTLTKDGLINAIETVISDKSYRENILRLRTLMQDQKEPPLERAVRWIEYTLQHGGIKHMRAAAANLTWSQYYEFEIIFIVVNLIFLSLGFLIMFVSSITKYILGLYEQKLKQT